MSHTDIADSLVMPQSETRRIDVFIIFARGEALFAKIHEVFESLGAAIYSIDTNAAKCAESLSEATTRIGDLKLVLYSSTTLAAPVTQKGRLPCTSILVPRPRDEELVSP